VFPLPAAPCTTWWPPARIAACTSAAAAAGRVWVWVMGRFHHRPPTSPWWAGSSLLLRVRPAVGPAGAQGDGLLLHHRGQLILARARQVVVPEQMADLVVDHIVPVQRTAPAGVQELLRGLGVAPRVDHCPALVRARVEPQGAQ